MRDRLAVLSGATTSDLPAVRNAVGALLDQGLVVPTAKAMTRTAEARALRRSPDTVTLAGVED
jgi:hypothetical protein